MLVFKLAKNRITRYSHASAFTHFFLSLTKFSCTASLTKIHTNIHTHAHWSVCTTADTTLLLWFVWLSALLSWLVCAPGRESSTLSSVCHCVSTLERIGQSVQSFLTPVSLYTLKNNLSCYFSSLSLSLFVSTLSVWQGSTESCNNTEEEEMKGRKGTCQTFTYSACLFTITLYFIPGFVTLWNSRLDGDLVLFHFIFEIMHVRNLSTHLQSG